MSKIKPFFATALLLIIAVSCNNKPNDKQIQDNVAKQLQQNKSYAGVTSTVKDGTVTLSGTCEGDNCAADIENNIKGVDGVQKVENNITKDNSTDLTMRTSVQSIITKYPGVQADVAGGVIVLRGSIDRDNLQSLMSDLGALHPEKIDNQLVVK
ncbi:MAG: BON domain-containing protein [Bacteroidota bacterium]|nr:BON domain-containing protein [Bacteroidota bacterium]MDQ6902707.1 BON domain-containing protein [Bacteroidota bacterium]